MKASNLYGTLLTAALTCLLALGTPNGHAEIRPDLGSGLALRDAQADYAAPVSLLPAQNQRTHAMAQWGESPLPPVPGNTNQRFSQVDAGGSATCGILKANKRLLCWGLNDFGQASPPIGTYKSVAMGENHGCAVSTEGHLRCWGLSSAMPAPGQARGRYLSVAAGDDHTCARRLNKTIACWGNNENGELNAPGGKFRQVVARGDHSCAVSQSHQLLCWGEKAFTEYGQTLRAPVKKVVTGQLHACVLKTDGQTVCWGNGIHGETQAPADRFIDLVAGDWHTCGLRADHSALCWGRNQYGQTQLGPNAFRMIAAGGMQTCGILRGNSRITCHGSFASNEVWYPGDDNATTSAYQNDGIVRPQLAFLAVLQGVSALLGSGIVNTGKMVDQKMDKWEGRLVPAQLAALVTSMFLGWFAPKDDTLTKVYDLLKDIQADIRKIEKGLDEAKNQLNRTELAVLTSWCDSRLESYAKTFDLLSGDAYGSNTGARSAYVRLLKKQEEILTQSIEQKKMVPYPAQELERFRNHYISQLKSARYLLASSLTGANQVQTPALRACFEQGYAEWRTNQSNGGAYPFDDRGIYEKAYKVLRGALLMQGEILQMEQDIEMQTAYQKLVEQRVDKVPPIDFNPRDHALGFCLYADERKVRSHKEYSPRWIEVAAICQENRDRIQNAYVDMVNEIEVAGGAYSDDQMVLSLTTKQMGLPDSGDKNWLWMRNIPDQNVTLNLKDEHGSVTGKWLDFHSRRDVSPFVFIPPFNLRSDAAIYYKNKGNWNAVERQISYDQGVWHSNGKAWNDLFKFREASRKKYEIEKQKEDVLEGMVKLRDLTSSPCKRDTNGHCKFKRDVMGNDQMIPGDRLPLFSGLSERPFWMLGEDYYFDVRYKSESKYINPFEGSIAERMLCFVAEGINRGGDFHPDRNNSIWEDLYLSGKVCKSEEMAAMSVRAYDSGYVNGIDCNGSGWCVGIGFDALETNAYKPYKKWLGGYFTRAYRGWDGAVSYWWHWMWDLGTFKPAASTNGNMYHMPVVNVAERKCKTKMTGGGARESFRTAGGVQFPSICGEDMDKLIQQVIPRPEYPPVPESLVRLPEVD